MPQKNLKQLLTTEELSKGFNGPYELVHRAIEIARDAIHNGYAVKPGDYKNLAYQVLQGIHEGRETLERPVIIEEEEEEFIEEEEIEISVESAEADLTEEEAE